MNRQQNKLAIQLTSNSSIICVQVKTDVNMCLSEEREKKSLYLAWGKAVRVFGSQGLPGQTCINS